MVVVVGQEQANPQQKNGKIKERRRVREGGG